jgi:transposase InsO family protein
MTKDDVLFGYRLQLFDLAQRTTVSDACRTFGVHRSTYYRWKHQVERHGLEMLRPRERRRPQMPNQTPQIIEERIVAFSLGHPGLGPRRIAAQLARPEWGGLRVSPNGVWKVLRRHGISTRAKRLGLIAGYRAPYEPPREPAVEPHITTTRPGELVGIDCFFVGRLSDTKGAVWQVTAIDTYSSYAWVDLVGAPTTGPQAEHTIPLARRVARELAQADWRLERVLTDNGNEFRARRFGETITALGATQTRIRAGRPQTNGHVERLHRTILEECWRPAFARFQFPTPTGLKRHLHAYLTYYNNQRAHTGRTTAGRCPADLVYGARKMKPR